MFITEDELLPAITSVLRRKSEALIGKDLLTNGNNIERKKRQEAVETKISLLRQAVDTNRRYLKGLYENLISDFLTDDEYFSMKSDYEVKITAALNEINNLVNEEKTFKDNASHYRDMADNAKKLNRKKYKLTYEMIEKLIDRITVNSDKEIEITLKFKSEFVGESEAYL